jgi:hypothetical protein
MNVRRLTNGVACVGMISRTARRASVLAAALFVLSAGHATGAPQDTQPPARPPKAVSELQSATIPALRGPRAKTLPPLARQFARTRAQIGDFAPNASLARAIKLPPLAGGIGATTWYVMPARGGVCLFGGRVGSCIPDALARKGLLWLQTIAPVGLQPVPPAGQPVPSTIVGVAPDGVTGVVAKQQSGQEVVGVVSKGLFVVSGVDVSTVALKIDVVLPPLPGR